MEELFACATDAVNVDGVPSEIRLLPIGFVHSQKGDFSVDNESVDLIIKQFKDRKLDLVIDYEHQTLSDIQAPASGWIKEIHKGTDAIVAKVEWTEKAKEYLKNKEYRYLSPVVLVRKRDNRATAIHSVALTNTPAIDGMYPIVNSNKINLEGEDCMELKELALLLGLSENATEDEVKAKLGELAATSKKEDDPAKGEEKEQLSNQDKKETEVVANSVVLSLLGLKEGAKTEDVAATIMALKAGDLNSALELKALKEKIENREADEVVAKALKDGKITAAQKEWAKSYALKDSEGFKNFVEKAPVVVAMGKTELEDAPKSLGNESYDVQVLKNMNISEDDVKEYYK